MPIGGGQAADTHGFCGCQPVVCGDIYLGSLSTELIVTAPLDYSMHNQGSAQMTSNTLHNDGHDELVQAKWELQGVYSMTPFFAKIDLLKELAEPTKST